MLQPGTYTPGQCCNGYCVPVPVGDDNLTAEDQIVHDLRDDQAHRLSDLLGLLDPSTSSETTVEP